MNKISVYRGDSADINVSVQDSNKNTFDLTGFSAVLTVKKKATDETIQIQSTGTIDEPTSGNIVFSISSTETDILVGMYVYDIQIASSTKVYTVVKDRFEIKQDVNN